MAENTRHDLLIMHLSGNFRLTRALGGRYQGEVQGWVTVIPPHEHLYKCVIATAAMRYFATSATTIPTVGHSFVTNVMHWLHPSILAFQIIKQFWNKFGKQWDT